MGQSNHSRVNTSLKLFQERSIAKNGTWGGTTVTNFQPGDSISIRMMSSATSGATVSGSVQVGNTVSSTWNVVTRDACPGVTTIGQECPDGTVYAGLRTGTGTKMYTTHCDAGMTWEGGACTGTRATYTWNNGLSPTIVTGYASLSDGYANTDGLGALVNAESPYFAPKYCYDLSAHTHTDWYLPAANELAVLCTNKATIGNFYTVSTSVYYLQSAEYSSSRIYGRTFNGCSQTATLGKATTSSYTRCVRRD